jgi:hypothetical protein
VSRDDSAVLYIGEWWLPSAPGNKIRGTLMVSAGDRATFVLEPGESLGPTPDAGGPIVNKFSIHLRQTYPIILGEAYEILAKNRDYPRRFLTLGNCYIEPNLSSLSRPVSYSIGVVVAGDTHVPSLCFNELWFDIPNLVGAFPGNDPFRTSYYPDPRLSTGGLAFAVHGVVQRWFLNSGYGLLSPHPDTEIRFVHDIEIGHPPSCTTSLTDKYRMTLRSRSRKKTWSIQSAQWFWEDFSQFFWLVTGLRPACRHITATGYDSSQGTTFDIYSSRLADGSPFSFDASTDSEARPHALFNVTEMASRDIGFLWSNWSLVRLGLSDVLLLRGLGRQLSQRGHFDEALLMNVAALESLHRVWIPDLRPPDSTPKRGVRTGNLTLLAYVTRLAHQYVPELKSHAVALSLAISDYRNYVAHHDAATEARYHSWPDNLLEVVPRFCEFLLDMTLLDFVGSRGYRRSLRTSDQTRMAKKHAAYFEYVDLVRYIVREMDKLSSKSSEMG